MKKYITAAILLFSVSIFSQIVNEPLHRDIYNYLGRLSQKGVIDFDDLILPLSRKYIAEKLQELKLKDMQLTNLEKEELEFYSKDFYMELEEIGKDSNDKRLSYFSNDRGGKFRFFSYSDDIFKVNLNPIVGYEISFKEKDRVNHSWNGLNLYGYLGESFGFSFDFRSNNENGSGADFKKIFTPVTGIISNNRKHNFNYAQVKTMLAYNWSWGNLSAGKDFIEYGYGQSGKLVLSKKAPPFPFVRLSVNPVDWFTFNYFHAWLSSNVIDSVNLSEYRRNIYRNKYFAWHSVIVTPFTGLDISLGESVVYSDQIEAIYLMPLMFFYLADDFISNRVNKPGDANSQIFASVSSKDHIKNTHIYGTLFIDELTIPGVSGVGTIFIEGNANENITDSRNLRTQLSYTFGVSVTDIPLDNLTISSEYTKINPFVYGHHTPAQTYTSSSYIMGHWIGHNSDLLYLKLNYRFLRGLQTNLWWQYIRKGSPDYSGQYKKPQPEFLFGLKNYFTYYGIDLKYEFIHDLNFQFKYLLTQVKQENEDGSFNEFETNEISFTVYY
ncbi:MAG: hypothetical protein EHM47_12370, partial [Ignavibacteriales bacterium]